MKKLVMLFMIGTVCSILGAAETEVYKTDFKKESFAWAQYPGMHKTERNNVLVTEVAAAPAGAKVAPTSIQIGVNVPKGFAAGEYRMDCTITISMNCRETVSVIRNSPPWTVFGRQTVDFKSGVPAKISIPFTLKSNADYQIRGASMAIGKFPVGTKVTIRDARIVKITR